MTLTRQQQDHYDMKKGFDRRDGQIDVSAEQRALFEGVSDWHMGHLCGGFGKDVGAAFQDATISRDEFDTVCTTAPGELEQVLDAVEELL